MYGKSPVPDTEQPWTISRVLDGMSTIFIYPSRIDLPSNPILHLSPSGGRARNGQVALGSSINEARRSSVLRSMKWNVASMGRTSEAGPSSLQGHRNSNELLHGGGPRSVSR